MVRLTARRRLGGKHVAAVSRQEIAIASGIPLYRITEISRMFDWSEVSVAEAERFCAACGFDPTHAEDRNRQQHYNRKCQQKNRPPHYLRVSPLWETEFVPLIRLLKSRQNSFAASSQSPSAPTRSAA
jgi:hypothetical protein